MRRMMLGISQEKLGKAQNHPALGPSFAAAGWAQLNRTGLDAGARMGFAFA
jgi:hypothetical protein